MPLLETVPEVQTLAPGVRLACLPEARYKRAELQLDFDRPLDGQSPARTLLAMVLLQGTERHPSAMHLEQAMEQCYGASVDFSGDRMGEMHRMSLELTWVGERFLPPGDAAGLSAAVLALGRELLEEPHRGPAGAPFPDATLERERAQLLRRIASLKDDRQAYAEERFLALLCAGEPLGRPPYGDEAEVAALTAADLERARLDLLRRSAVSAIAVGPLAAERIAAALEGWLGAGGPHAAAARQEPPPPQLRVPERLREQRERLPIDQARFFLGFRFVPPRSGPEMEALTLANGLFGGGSHGRLFRVVREQRSRAYGIYSTLRTRKGILTVEAGIDAAHYGEVRDEVLAQWQAIARGDFTPDELEMARANVHNDLQSLADSAAAVAHYYARELHLGFLRSPAQRAAMLAAVTPAQVAAAAAAWQPDLAYLLAA